MDTNTQEMLKHLNDAREKLVVEAICRKTGRTNFDVVNELPQVYRTRGKIQPYADGTAVFSFDGEDLLLFHSIKKMDDGRLAQAIEHLYDKEDYVVEEDKDRR